MVGPLSWPTRPACGPQPIHSRQQASRALTHSSALLTWRCAVPPTVVVRAGQEPTRLLLPLPAAREAQPLQSTVREEGGRVHERHPTKGFPAEWMLRHFSAVRGRVRELPPTDTVEVGSLWTTPSGRKSGVPRLVAQACIGAALALGKRTAFIVSHAQFEPVLRGLGMKALEGAPEVPFPTASYRSRIHTVDLAVLARAITAYVRSGRSDLLERYSQTCLRRVWKAQRFSWWMTQMFHLHPDDNAFDRKRQLAELDYFVSSDAGQVAFAENYVGLPVEA